MDQNILRLTKLYYRNSLLSSVVSTEDGMAAALNKISLKDPMIHLDVAWEKLSPTVIEKCWRNILPHFSKHNEDADEDNIPLRGYPHL